MKKLIIIAILSVFAVSLAACGSSDTPAAPKHVPSVIGMNPQEAIDVLHAGKIKHVNSNGGLGLDSDTGYAVCNQDPDPGTEITGDVTTVTVNSKRSCKAKSEKAKSDRAAYNSAQAPTPEPDTTPAPAPESSKPEMTAGQENALQSAHDYLDYGAFSKSGLIEQLSSDAGEGFPRADAVWAVDRVGVSWREQAVKSAQEYLDSGSFSKAGLIDQLSSSAGEKFTLAQAQYGVDKAYR